MEAQEDGKNGSISEIPDQVTAYFMVGSSDGLKVGGGTNVNLTAGNCDDICAYFKGNIEMEMAISTGPLHITGDYNADLSSGGCIDGHCAGLGVSVGAHAEALPPYLKYTATLDLPCPLPDIKVGLQVLPHPKPDFDVDSCFDIF